MSVHCQTESPGSSRHVLRWDEHNMTVVTDATKAGGGTATAPDAHDYFDASLAACKALTAFVYAKARNIALERVEVDVERDASREREGTYVLKVKVALFGGLSADEKKKVHDVLERCPIHKLMTKTTIEIQTEPLAP